MANNNYSGPGFAFPVDGNSVPWGRRHLDSMLLAAKDVKNIPVFGPGLAGFAGAVLDVSAPNLLTAIAARVGTHCSTGHCSTGSKNILAVTPADLVTENAAKDSPDNCARHIGFAPILHHRLPFDPAALLWGANHGADGGHVRLIKPFIIAPLVVINRNGHWRKTLVIDTGVPAYGSC